MSLENALYLDGEPFLTIQGESSFMGKPCVFIRLFGCNVGCSYCDQPQLLKNKKPWSISRLISAVSSFHVPYVCITGGEPLMQWDNLYPLILELNSMGIKVSIETSGCVPIEADYYKRSHVYIMDVKCPSSGAEKKNIYDNLTKLQMQDEVKFVISNKEDYKFMKKILSRYPTSASILISPCMDKDFKPLISVSEIFDWVVEDGLYLYKLRFQTQLHKLWGIK